MTAATTLDDVVRQYTAAWTIHDEAERREALEAAMTDDATYTDPLAHVEGREALVAHIGGFFERFAGRQMALTSGADGHHGHVRFGWAIQEPDGTPVLEGIDIGDLAPDGRLQRIVGFFGPLPAKG